MKKILIRNKEFKQMDRSVACIGYFDGVHIGHQKLINETIRQAKKLNVKSCVICFEPDPVNLINKSKNRHILSYKNRLMAFEYFGIDQVIVIRFDEDFMKVSANSFIKDYLNKFNIEKLVCGFDYSFGYKASGNCELLKTKGKFETIVIPETKYRGSKVSSTRIKECFIRGDFSLTNRLLGWEYFIDLKVVNCTKKGSKWLVEAKMTDPNGILPQDDKYSDNLEIKSNRVYITGPSRLKKDTHLFLTF